MNAYAVYLPEERVVVKADKFEKTGVGDYIFHADTERKRIEVARFSDREVLAIINTEYEVRT